MPFVYLLAGGISFRALVPSTLFNLIRGIERLGLDKRMGMFARIEIIKLP
jgi:hypothetical protein